MQITNNLGLPEPLVNAIRNDPYTRGDSDISVTTLIGPPQIRRLLEKHRDVLSEDASERIWALLGQSVHTILERAKSSGIQERRLYMKVGDKTLSGQFDHLVLLPDCVLQDYKVTSVWPVIFGKDEWEWQLNVLAELCEQNGYTVDRLQIVAIIRDWQRSKAGLDPTYPDNQVKVIPIRLWPKERRLAYIKERMALHFDGEVECTDRDRWYQGDTFAVKKKDGKQALRVLDTEQDAINWMAETGRGDLIEKRSGAYRRCQTYCPVRTVCPQWNRKQEAA